MDVEVLNSSVFVTKLDAPLLCETAGKLAGGEAPERFRTEPMLSLASPRGIRFWRRLTSIWRDVRKDAPWLRSAPAVDEARSRLAEALIDAIGRAGSDRAPACGPAALQRAEEFVLTHLGESISHADLCAAAGASARRLSRAFERRHGVGPVAFLRQRRLDAAQRLLLALPNRLLGT